jgi:hypothetical protein
MRSKIFAVLLASACALFFAANASAADSVYWTNTSGGDMIGHADLSGGGGGEFGTSGLGVAPGGAIDAATGKIYWLEPLSGTIGDANLDGSDQGTLDTTGAPIDFATTVAIDPGAGRIYWINGEMSAPSLGYANLDGSGGGAIPMPGADVNTAFGAAIDPSLGRIYWANAGDSTIGYANLDGSEAGTLPIEGPETPVSPTGVAIDAAQGRIYWTEQNGGEGAIGYANLDGSESGHLDLAGTAIGEPFGLAIDPSTESIYWADQETQSISVASLAGTGGFELDTTGASTADAWSPMLLVAPRPGPAAPVTPSAAEPGATLTCPGVGWQPDLVESHLYDAPERTAISWTFEGATVEGATGATLRAAQVGTYGCLVTATNAAGSTTVRAGTFQVATPSNSNSGTDSNSNSGSNSNQNSNSTPAPGSRSKAPGSRSKAPGKGDTPSSQGSSVRVTKVTYLKAAGTATVLVKASGAGKVTLSGKGVIGASAKSSGSGIAKLKVAAAGQARKALRRTGTAKVTVTIKFTGSGGTASKKQALTLRLDRRG